MVFVALGLGGLAVLLAFLAKKQGGKAYAMQLTETVAAAELARQADEIVKEIGGGSFSKPAELKGTVECAAPLTAEMSGSPCVWYRSVVTRDYEESYAERDADGKTRTGTRRGSEQLSSNERRVAFYLRDESGATLVEPEGASIDGERVLSRYEQNFSGPSIQLGAFRLKIGPLGGGRRTLGFKLEEWALPVGARVYVLGEARDDEGRLRVAKPGTKSLPFIISRRSEEELVKAAKGGSLALTIAAAVVALGAVAVAVLGFVGLK